MLLPAGMFKGRKRVKLCTQRLIRLNIYLSNIMLMKETFVKTC